MEVAFTGFKESYLVLFGQKDHDTRLWKWDCNLGSREREKSSIEEERGRGNNTLLLFDIQN